MPFFLYIVFMIADVIELAEYLQANSPDKLIKKAVEDSETEALIVDLNTRGQLGRFINSEGVRLSDIGGEYALITQFEKGLGPTEVNLNDTGDYWNSYQVNAVKGGYEITSDPIKDGDNLENRYGDNLEGLTTENKKNAEGIIEKKIWEQAQRAL